MSWVLGVLPPDLLACQLGVVGLLGVISSSRRTDLLVLFCLQSASSSHKFSCSLMGFDELVALCLGVRTPTPLSQVAPEPSLCRGC